MGTLRKIKSRANKVVDRYIYEPIERIGDPFIEPIREGIKEITGVNAMEEANQIQRDALEEQKRQYEEQKAAALAEEEALARKAEQEKADASASAYRKLEEDRRRRAAMKGRSSTILTSSLGDTGLTVQRRTLLGG
jgi:hypothetical protein